MLKVELTKPEVQALLKIIREWQPSTAMAIADRNRLYGLLDKIYYKIYGTDA